MRMRNLAAAAVVLTASGCQTWGPTWSEVTGVRYHRAIADRWPARIVAVGNDAVFQTPYKVAPGTYRLAVESPRHDGFPGTILEMTLNIEPCKRYYVNAQFAGPVGPDWRPVVDEVESIAGCRVTS
ncbi:MAG TPA: hypothetical protein VEO36_01855 [Casimicrobiaceae bacterium]|nr:hypothetical protein [Casimicrobiaceae bacterium]